MPRKQKPQATPPTSRPWTAPEISLLRRRFADETNIELASRFGRTVKSVIRKAAALGLAKSAAHRSAQSRQTALAHVKTSEEMAALGSIGGRIGGKARAESLTPAARKKIAKNAIKTRWAKRDSNRRAGK